jgi:hypothetical protein
LERATVFLYTRRPVLLSGNRFTNDLNRAELIVSDYYYYYDYTINATGNWFGSADDAFVRSRVIDYGRSQRFMKVQYHPYCIDASCTTLSSANVNNSYDFVQSGSFLGGQLTSNVTVAAGNYTCGGFGIRAGYRLELQAGVTCRFLPMAVAEVYGTLSLPGTAAQPIVLTSAQIVPAPGDWGTVWFRAQQTINASRISNVQMSFGGYERYIGSSIGNLMFDTAPETPVVNVTLTDSRVDGIIVFNNYDALMYVFENLVASSNRRYGMNFAAGSAWALFSGGVFSDNGADGFYLYAVRNATIVGVQFSNNGVLGGGEMSGLLAFTNYNGLSISDCRFMSNRRWGYYYRYGSYYAKTTLQNSLLSLNGETASGGAGGGGGVYLYGYYLYQDVHVTNCTFDANNNTAMYINGGQYINEQGVSLKEGRTTMATGFISFPSLCHTQFSYEYHVTNNVFQNHNCSVDGCVTMRVYFDYGATAAHITIDGNTFVNNTAHTAVVYVDNYDYAAEVAPGSQFLIGNTLVNNSVTGNTRSTIWSDSRMLNLTCNTLSNPTNLYEFYSASSSSGSSVAATMNYWGEGVVNETSGKRKKKKRDLWNHAQSHYRLFGFSHITLHVTSYESYL